MKTGFIGLGQQGKYLAINLVAAGHDLMVYDIRREPLEELVRAGATVADSPRAIGRHAEVTAICVLNDAQLLVFVSRRPQRCEFYKKTSAFAAGTPIAGQL